MLNTSSFLHRDQTDCVRGISVLLIAIFHVLLTWDGMPRYINLTGSVCVAAFLFLSGFGIHESYKKTGLKDYWHKRFKRIILPYTLFITILIPFNDHFSWKDYMLDITYIDSSYWFIEFLVWNYIIYWIAQRFFSKHLFIVFLIAGLIGLHVLMQMEAEQCFSFLAGIIASHYIDDIRSVTPKRLIWFTILCFLFGFFFLLLKEIPAVHSYRGTQIYNYILLMIKLPMSFTLLLIPTVFPFIVRSKVLYWAGISSLEIYLVHLALLDYVQMDYTRLLLYVVFTIVFSYLFYRVNQLILRF